MIFRLGDELIDTGACRTVVDIDSSPFPDRDLFDTEKYNDWVGLSVGKRIYYMIGARGCPHSCRFCTDPFNVYRQRSPANVMSELQQLGKYKPDIVVFVDDQFFAGRSWALELLNLIGDAQLPMRLVLQTRVDSVDTETVKACKRAGVGLIQIGIDSGNQQIIDYYRKGFSLSQARSAVKLIDRYGIYSLGFLIIGAPMEREEHINDTLKFVTSIPLDFIAISPLAYRYPSPLWKDLVKKGLVGDDEMGVLAGERTGSYPSHELGR
ncbi:MAG: radical SAM protein [Acidobacteriota bacterium]